MKKADGLTDTGNWNAGSSVSEKNQGIHSTAGMTYGEICTALRSADVENAEWDALLLLEHFCGVTRSQVLSAPGQKYRGDALYSAVQKRAQRVPLQYLLGVWDFYRQSYEVSPDCLIPRPDTELLVEEAIRTLPQGAFFADLCTGSGCIAISVLAERPDTHAVAVDLSPAALAVAERNACRNGVSDRFFAVHADVLHASQTLTDAFPRPAAILSNPPYIRTDVLDSLSPEVKQEPRMALDGGGDGLLFYRALLGIAADWLGAAGFCLFEIGFDQGEAVSALAEKHGFSCELRKDYGGCDRLAILKQGHVSCIN